MACSSREGHMIAEQVRAASRPCIFRNSACSQPDPTAFRAVNTTIAERQFVESTDSCPACLIASVVHADGAIIGSLKKEKSSLNVCTVRFPNQRS
jgi:hypothetical protein